MSDSNSIPHDCDAATFAHLASQLARHCTQAIDGDRLADIPTDVLGQLFASVVRLYAAKAQLGATPPPFGRHGTVTATDVAIGCTAMLEGVGLTLFDLGAWQTLASVRPAKHSSASPVSAETAHDVKYQAA
jgi:hypothetical protein